MGMYDDPRILRAIAHPTRNRVLHELSASGSLRAADIARSLDIPANQASFHLRQLAKYGLVEEDAEAARDKRDRVWRLADADGIRFRTGDMLAQPGGRAAYAVFERNSAAWGHHLVDQALAYEEGVEKSIGEWTLRMTSEEFQQLTEELITLIERYRSAGVRPAGARPESEEDDGRQTYSILQLIQPYPAPAGEDPVKENVRVVGFGSDPDDESGESGESGG